jgi:hypothetical protein
MATTSRLALRYPVLADSPDVPRDIGNLAADLDPKTVIFSQGTLASRPAAAITGRFYYATDNGLLYYDTGSAWVAINPAGTVDGPAGTGTLRTLGSGALQAAPGNDARLSDQRVPTNGSVDISKVAASLIPSSGAGAAVEALRAIGGGAGQVVAGNDSRLTDQRVPTANSVDSSKIVDGSVALADLAANSVDAGKIVDGSVGTAELATGAVDTSKILDGTITNADIAAAAAIADSKLASPNSGKYRLLHRVIGHNQAPHGANTYYFNKSNMLDNSNSAAAAPEIFHLDAADLDIAGLTEKLKVKVSLFINATAPGAGIMVPGLYALSSVGGGAGIIGAVLGSVVTGSNTTSFNNPAAGSSTFQQTADFNLPADGFYLFAVSIPGAVANSSIVAWNIELWGRSV